ncbi:hypothetical protein [Streptomyces graminilatus]|uniref:hypothetical protein n=1 Tax=Streptomyces graminilatus TaxID=1464070 RepID=UPI0006E28172|nr:hypothetical protein [Streptomyces graminilatus]
MTDTTEATATEGNAIDFDAIRHAAKGVPKFTDDQADEAAACAERLCGYVRQLLVVVETSPQPVGADAAHLREARGKLVQWARDTLEGDEPTSTFYLENLALHCRLLVSLAAKAADRVEYCCWCNSYKTGTRVIHSVEAGTGPGAVLSACPKCRESYGLIPLSERPAAV